MTTGTKASVDCKQADHLMDAHFGKVATSIPGAVLRHLRQCERCARLYEWLLSGCDAGVSTEAVEASVGEKITAALEPVKPLPATGVLVSRCVAVYGFLVVVLVGIMGLAGYHVMGITQLVVVAAVLGAAAFLLSLSLSWQMVPGKYQTVSAPFVIGASTAGFVLAAAFLFPWETSSSQLFGVGWGCTGLGLTMAIPTGAVMLFLVSRGAPLSYRTLGTTLGATSGLLALTVLQLACSNQHAGHLLFWHGAVVAICVGAGYALGIVAEQIASRGSRNSR